ncbi:gelation factor [Pelomyxa schiedti]|nr:gelation factor [Pelomyxa schiedti]
MSGSDERLQEQWVLVQKKTFTRWANTHLVGRNMHIEDIAKDLNDGILLANLIELISDKKVPHNKNPRMRVHKLENTTFCLKFLENEGLKLVNIAAPNIIDGNLKLILGLIWTIILRYQIQKGREEANKNALLDWVRSKIPEYNINNFTDSWADGMAICALVNALKQERPIDMSTRSPGRALENATIGINTAETQMDIPPLILPEDLVAASDALSMMTYISYFRDYDDKMQKMQDAMAIKRAQELAERTPDPSKCTASGDGLACAEVNIPATFKIVAKNQFGRQCPCGGAEWRVSLTAPDGTQIPPSDISIEDKGDGSYITTYVPRKAGPNKLAVTLNDIHIIKSPFLVSVSPPVADPSKCKAFGPGVEGCDAAAPTHFTIQACNKLGDPITCGGAQFVTAVKGPFGDDIPSKTVDNGDGTYTATYQPSPGEDVVSVAVHSKPIANSPFHVTVSQDPNAATAALSYAFGPGIDGPVETFHPTSFTIQAVTPNGEKLTKGGDLFSVEVCTPQDDELPGATVVDNGNGTYTASYHAPLPGKHKISIALHHPYTPLYWTHIKDSPKILDVEPGVDPKKCHAFGPGLGNDVSDTKPTEFTLEAKDVTGKRMDKGGFPFVPKVVGPTGAEAPSHIDDNGDGTYNITYSPDVKGKHTITLTLEGQSVAESPYTVNVKAGADFAHTCIERYSFTIVARNKAGELHKKGGDPFTPVISTPSGPIKTQPKLEDKGDGTYNVSYALPEAGAYTVTTTLHGHNIRHSPFTQSNSN